MLPAGPSIVDVLANSAFYYGVLRMLAADDRPVWTKMSFAAAEHNFHGVRPPGASSRGSTGPASARCAADELVLRHLLPLAHEGLEQWGVSAAGAGPLPRRDRGPVHVRA